MKNETFEEYKYAIRHKPTKKWVNFKNDDLELIATAIELVDFKDCLIVAARDYLELFLKRSSFNNTPNYGIENFFGPTPVLSVQGILEEDLPNMQKYIDYLIK